jgi:hypothetical protein
MIRIQMHVGPQAGLQMTYSEPRLTFGRAPQNNIAIDDQHLSRFHGELLFQNEHWMLVNQSPNGVTINRRSVTGKEPQTLRPGDVIGVGGTKIFTVQFVPSAAAQARAHTATEEAPAKPRMSRRAKIWTAIGVYIGIIVVIVGILSFRGGASTASLSLPVMLTEQQITSIIREKPQVNTRDEREAQNHLKEARAAYAHIETVPDALFNAYNHYKLARANLRQGLEDVDQLQFTAAEDQLVKRVTADYEVAAKLLRNRDYAQAQEAFTKLRRLYPETRNDLGKNISEHLNYAEAFRPKQKSMFSK